MHLICGTLPRWRSIGCSLFGHTLTVDSACVAGLADMMRAFVLLSTPRANFGPSRISIFCRSRPRVIHIHGSRDLPVAWLESPSVSFWSKTRETLAIIAAISLKSFIKIINDHS